MSIDELTPEQRARLSEHDEPEKILAVVGAEGKELTDDELEMVSGGWGKSKEEGSNPLGATCPSCGNNVAITVVERQGAKARVRCNQCGTVFYTDAK